MTFQDKCDLLIIYDELDFLTYEHFLVLRELYCDNDSLIRSQVASLLINFITQESKNMLLELACDKDSLVRTEAYDSLSAFPFLDVENFLFNAMQKETDTLAKSYVIISWADVLLSLSHYNQETIDNIQRIKINEESECCKLSYCYALYLFGNKEVLNEILCFLKNSDYHIRCSTISLLNDIVDENNKGHIKEAIIQLLISEDTIAVRDKAKRFLHDI